MDLEWTSQKPIAGELSAVGNVLRAGFSTRNDIAFLSIGGVGDLNYYGRDNVAVGRLGAALPMFGRYTTSPARIVELDSPTMWPEGLDVLPPNEVETHLLRFAGARPWDRDAHDLRILFDVAEGRGKIIDDEDEVGGYPAQQMARADLCSRRLEPRYDGAKVGPLSGPARRLCGAAHDVARP
jgi:hypothetical protein